MGARGGLLVVHPADGGLFSLPSRKGTSPARFGNGRSPFYNTLYRRMIPCQPAPSRRLGPVVKTPKPPALTPGPLLAPPASVSAGRHPTPAKSLARPGARLWPAPTLRSQSTNQSGARCG